MATFLPGVTDYIPQIQPYQPDFNFLGNMLQTKQSAYDTNYKQLSQKYGTIINSEMLREDNIQKRNEFLKVIDQDIKKISGLDLSLQQNNDAAGKVFDSFFENKDMVHDMVYTKEYRSQLGIAESFKNCLDQEKCGGKYWDVGVQLLHYKADEYKKADKGTAMNISPGKFIPQINVKEKTVNYLKDLIGKQGLGGIQNIVKSPDGNYLVTMENGKLLEAPFTQLVEAQFAKDQKIQDMYNAMAYVQRKGYAAQNAEAYGSEEAAEDAYFQSLDNEAAILKLPAKEAKEIQEKVTNLSKILEKEIKEKGSTGDDDLSKSYRTSVINKAVSDQIAEYYDGIDKTIDSYFEPTDSRDVKRQKADMLMSRSFMSKELKESAMRAVAMTGSVKDIQADPYAKSYYDFNLDMKKQQAQFGHDKEMAMLNASLDFKSKNIGFI
jgi:hypothetical protein